MNVEPGKLYLGPRSPALSDIKWPSWGAVWPSGWAVTTKPAGKSSPGANHLPWEWSKLPWLNGKLPMSPL